MPVVGTILQGWGCSVIYLYDNDKGKKDGEKNLTKNWLVTKELIEAISKDKGSIEDIFSIEDFKKYVLDNPKLKYSSSNSEYITNKKSDKVLLSRLYLQKVQTAKISLDSTTKDNVKKLLETIRLKFKSK